MHYLLTFKRFRYLALTLITVLMVAAARAQEFPVALDSIEPAEGLPGQDLEVTLRGRGFGEANEVVLIIGELEVWEIWVVSDREMGALIYIPEDSRPGSRDVEVVAVFGQNEEIPAVLVSGFTVLEMAVPPPVPPFPDEYEEPPGPPDDGFGGLDLILLVLLGGIMLVSGSAVIGLTLVWRRAVVRQKWQAQATENELPQTCQGGNHYVRREKPKIKPGRWKVVGLKVTVYDAGSKTAGSVHQAPAELVRSLENAAHQRLLHGISESLTAELEQIGQKLIANLLAWQSVSKAGADLYLQTKLEGGQAEQKFTHYRCAGTPGGWQKKGEWTLKLKAVDHLPRTVRGPGEGESPGAYSGFLREQVGSYLIELMEEAGSLF